MKVLCINTEPFDTTWDLKGLKKLKLYKTYKVAEVTPEGGYILKEVKTKSEVGFHQSRFIPVSKIDETTFSRNINKKEA